MFGTGKVVRGIQGRLQHVGSAAGLARRAAGKRTRSLQALGAKRDLVLLWGPSSSYRAAPFSTTASAERGEKFWMALLLGTPHPRQLHAYRRSVFGFSMLVERQLGKGTDTYAHTRIVRREPAGRVHHTAAVYTFVISASAGLVRCCLRLLQTVTLHQRLSLHFLLAYTHAAPSRDR